MIRGENHRRERDGADMKLIRTEDAVGHVLCHDMTQIIKDEYKDARFRRGHVVTVEDIPVLLSMGKEHLYVWEMTPAWSTRTTRRSACWRCAALCAENRLHRFHRQRGEKGPHQGRRRHSVRPAAAEDRDGRARHPRRHRRPGRGRAVPWLRGVPLPRLPLRQIRKRLCALPGAYRGDALFSWKYRGLRHHLCLRRLFRRIDPGCRGHCRHVRPGDLSR